MSTELAGPVLVTGATGFIGSHLALRLVGQGLRPRLFVRDPVRLLPELRECADIVRGELGDAATLQVALRDVATVFHCAANVATWDRWEAYRAANVAGVGTLLEAIRATRAGPLRLVHLSSVDVYGYPSRPCDESCAADGGAFGYGRSKAQGERLIRERARELGLGFVVLRPCNVIGPRSPFIQRIGDELRSGLMLRVDRGRADCGFLYVDNLIDVMLWAAQAPQALDQCFNVRDPGSVSWARFLADLRRGIDGRGLVVTLPFALADAAAAVLEAPNRWLRTRREPLLHRLLVRMFGRTCGHEIGRAAAAGAPLGAIDYDEAMRRSIAWYRNEVSR